MFVMTTRYPIKNILVLQSDKHISLRVGVAYSQAQADGRDGRRVKRYGGVPLRCEVVREVDVVRHELAKKSEAEEESLHWQLQRAKAKGGTLW